MSIRDQFDVLTAENCSKSLQVLTTTLEIDIVFSDLRMPKMDGLEFISKAKLVYKYFGKPFVKQELKDKIESHD